MSALFFLHAETPFCKTLIYEILPITLGARLWFDEGGVHSDGWNSTLNVWWNGYAEGPLKVEFNVKTEESFVYYQDGYECIELIAEQAREFILHMALRIRMFENLYEKDMRLIQQDIAYLLDYYRP